MNLSSLSGESVAALFADGATLKSNQTNANGALINVVGEKGVFSLYTSLTGGTACVLTIDVDGVSFSGSVTKLSGVFSSAKINSGDALVGLTYKKSLNVTVSNITSGSGEIIYIDRIS